MSEHEEPQVSILLVDDQPMGLALLEDTLKGLGQKMVKAQSGREALRHLLREEFAVILLDVVMPEMDGFETARLIRERKSSANVPIIFLTALSDGEVQQFRAYSIGAVDYVSKPAHPDMLRSKVSVFVELAKKTQALRKSNEQLREANRQVVEQQLRVLQSEKLASVGLLAAGVAHEINNPLMGVQNCVALLREGKAAPERREAYFDAITTALGQIGSTVQSLLRYAREQPVEFTTVDVGACVSTCLPLIAPVMRTRSVEVVQRIAPGEVVVKGNGSQLSQAAMNVLLNAVQASPPGSQIAISSLTEPGRVGVRFEDKGSGISEEELQKVCDPFYTTKSEGEGTGLGLAVTQGILHAHGGELSIASKQGAGTVVTFWLPLQSAAELPKSVLL